ncbi:MAG: copper amine oxidase N-terminal domain-containing protein [Dethiobacter sp.]|jgi:hypothetical protein|nr:MAG: copper amine oxidase N-terminal domain-containing protein [Dethiobacter sp.]
MHKKLIAFVLVVAMALGISGAVVAAPKKKNVPKWINSEGTEPVAGSEKCDEKNQEEALKEKKHVLSRQHSFKEKFIGPPAFVTEMKQEKIKVRGRPFLSDVPPVIKGGRILIPVKAVSNGLSADVGWNLQEQKVTITRGDITIEIFLGEAKFYVNGEERQFDVPAQLICNRTFVPLRFIAEALGEKFNYNSATGEVDIGEEENEEVSDSDDGEEENEEVSDGDDEQENT